MRIIKGSSFPRIMQGGILQLAKGSPALWQPESATQKSSNVISRTTNIVIHSENVNKREKRQKEKTKKKKKERTKERRIKKKKRGRRSKAKPKLKIL